MEHNPRPESPFRHLPAHLVGHATWEVIRDLTIPTVGGLGASLKNLGVSSHSFIIGLSFAFILNFAFGSPLIKDRLLSVIQGADVSSQMDYRKRFWTRWLVSLIVMTVAITLLHDHYANRIVFP